MQTPIIKVTNLHKKFGDLHVLKGVDFTANKGDVIVIIGPSGTGKSTFLRCLNYLEVPSEGTIEIDGSIIGAGKHSEKELIEFRKHTAMVFQNYSVFRNKTVLENVMMPMVKVQKMNKAEAEAKALELIGQVGLEEKVNEYPSRLSGGQQQRVGIARAMAVNPSILLFDEPTSSLDPELVAGILDIIRRLAKEHNRTMLIVTHEMRFALDIADEVIFMDEGGIAERGTPEELIKNPKNERTRKFLEQTL